MTIKPREAVVLPPGFDIGRISTTVRMYLPGTTVATAPSAGGDLAVVDGVRIVNHKLLHEVSWKDGEGKTRVAELSEVRETEGSLYVDMPLTFSGDIEAGSYESLQGPDGFLVRSYIRVSRSGSITFNYYIRLSPHGAVPFTTAVLVERAPEQEGNE
jgi:hypothetical protein